MVKAANNLKTAVTCTGMKISEFAKLLHWSPCRLSKFINARVNIPFEDKIKILNALNECLKKLKSKVRFSYEQIFAEEIPPEIIKYFNRR